MSDIEKMTMLHVDTIKGAIRKFEEEWYNKGDQRSLTDKK